MKHRKRQLTIALFITADTPPPCWQQIPAQHGMEVLTAHSLLDALGAYVFYVPHVVVLYAATATDRTLAQEVSYHLESLQETHVVTLTDTPGDFGAALPLHAHPLDVLRWLQALQQHTITL